MTKSDLIDKVAAKGKSKAEAEAAVNDVLQSITELTQRDGDKLIIRGFGTFERKHRAGHTGRNPRTGEEVQIAGSSRLTFKASKK